MISFKAYLKVKKTVSFRFDAGGRPFAEFISRSMMGT
tara:strand:+ start:1589 stop:1699 length:111 start_codon:yes stop_codon:yes gene_type:complete